MSVTIDVQQYQCHLLVNCALCFKAKYVTLSIIMGKKGVSAVQSYSR